MCPGLGESQYGRGVAAIAHLVRTATVQKATCMQAIADIQPLRHWTATASAGHSLHHHMRPTALHQAHSLDQLDHTGLYVQVPGDHKLAILQSAEDAKQLLRQLSVLRPAVPHWRRQRPSLMIEAAHIASSQDGAATLALQYAHPQTWSGDSDPGFVMLSELVPTGAAATALSAQICRPRLCTRFTQGWHGHRECLSVCAADRPPTL